MEAQEAKKRPTAKEYKNRNYILPMIHRRVLCQQLNMFVLARTHTFYQEAADTSSETIGSRKDDICKKQ